MRAHRTLKVAALVGLALLVSAPATAAAAKRLILGGSTSVLPLAQKLAAAYHHAYPQIPEPKVEGGQSDIGIAGVASGRFDIGDSSRDPLSTDPKTVRLHVDQDRARRDLRGDQRQEPRHQLLPGDESRSIFSGSIRDWSEVPGATASGPIDLFDRSSASGTQDAFQNIFMGEDLRISPSASAEDSNGEEQNAVSADANAIGFVSFAYTAGIHAAAYQGVACTLRNARSGQYGGVRNFWMITKGTPKGETKKFLGWVTSGNKTTKNIINSNWIAIY